jgi:hypothetical protein
MRSASELVAEAEVVTEAVGGGLERGEAGDVGLLLRGVGASGGEGHRDCLPRLLRSLFDGCAAAEDDEVGQGDFAGLLLDALKEGEDICKLLRLVDLPALLRLERDAGAIRAAALIRTAERRGRCPRGGDEL